MENHLRPDGSTCHVVNYDPATGGVSSRFTHQGAADSSAWARGQAWGMYGFTMTYRETGDLRFLAAARRLADYFIAHCPADGVPYWDFQAPGIPNTERDASAAAIACSALLELSDLVQDSSLKETYATAAKHTLTSLSAPPYLAEGTGSMGILNHAVGHRTANREVDVSLIYGDYYFVEALLRYKRVRSL
jgi:unsaturated chondroitin disaccharide hydrolase